jgi:hypothetical protein
VDYGKVVHLYKYLVMENNAATSNQKYILPAVLSLIIPGLGQIWKAHLWRSAAMIILLIILVVMDKMQLFEAYYVPFIVLHIALRCWSAYDAWSAGEDWK